MNLTREPMPFTQIRARISHHCFTRANGRIDNELINAPLDWLATTLNKSSLLYPGNSTNHSIMDMQILDTIAQNHPALRITIRCRRYTNWRGSFFTEAGSFDKRRSRRRRSAHSRFVSSNLQLNKSNSPTFLNLYCRCFLFGISHSYECRISLFRFKPIRMKFVNSFEIWIESAIFRHVVDFCSGPRTHFHARQRWKSELAHSEASDQRTSKFLLWQNTIICHKHCLFLV